MFLFLFLFSCCSVGGAALPCDHRRVPLTSAYFILRCLADVDAASVDWGSGNMNMAALRGRSNRRSKHNAGAAGAKSKAKPKATAVLRDKSQQPPPPKPNRSRVPPGARPPTSPGGPKPASRGVTTSGAAGAAGAGAGAVAVGKPGSIHDGKGVKSTTPALKTVPAPSGYGKASGFIGRGAAQWVFGSDDSDNSDDFGAWGKEGLYALWCCVRLACALRTPCALPRFVVLFLPCLCMCVCM